MIWSKLYRSRRLRGTIRVLTFLAVANLIATAFLLPSARAEAEEAAKRGGLELLKQLGPMLIGPPEVATINGQRMSLASKLTPLGVDEVLQRFERHCQEHSAGLAEELRQMPGFAAAARNLPEQVRDPSRWLSSRDVSEDGKTGQVACIARKDSGGGIKGLLDRVLAFAESGDLAQLGDARYVVARHDAQSGHTHVLAMWTEGSFNIPAMFPESGDAPGADPTHFARPEASRRVLSAALDGHPYALRMYDSERSHAEVLAYYDRHMKEKGWNTSALPTVEGQVDLNEHARAYAKLGAALIVVVHQTPVEKTGVSLIEMGSLGFARTQAVEAVEQGP